MVKSYYSMKPRSRSYSVMKDVFSNKRIRVVSYILVLLWIAVASQFIVNRFFVTKGNIIQAFVNTNSGLMESTLEITAEYGSGYLTDQDKKQLILYITSNLGIDVNNGLEQISEENREELSFTKQARQAQTTVKVVSLYNEETTEAFVQAQSEDTEVLHYLLVRLTIYEDVSNDILVYEQKLKDSIKELNIPEDKTNVTLQFSGAFAGDLTLETKNKIADRMIESLGGENVYENREEDLYTIYAYTGLLNEYITVDNNKINIQVAMTYEEDSDRTRIFLATPIISGEW